MHFRGGSRVRGSRGQVTVFIIVGLLAVILIVLIAYLLTKDSGVGNTDDVIKNQQRLQPVDSFIALCTEQTAKKALDIIGSQGGWISYDEQELTGEDFEFNEAVTESDGLQIVQRGPKIPYWYYLKSDTNCQDCEFDGKIPSLDLVAKQISWYIDKNIKTCLNNFDEFKKQNIAVKEFGQPKANTLITNEDIAIVLDYPVEFEVNGKTTRSDQHAINIDLNFKKIYDLALEIANAQKDLNFLEYNAMNIVSAYSSLDSNKLPPIAAATPGPGKIVWSKYQSEQIVKQYLSNNIGQITVPGTSNFYPPTSANANEDTEDFSLRQAASYSLVFPLVDSESDKYEQYDVSFSYMDWPIHFDITPRAGDLVRPEEISSILQGIMQVFVQNYRFFYDISYPVMIELHDNDAFNKKGYSFLFALESNVRNNEPLKAGVQFSLTPAGLAQNSLFSSPDSRISGNILVKALDESGTDIEGVNVKYSCAIDSVYLGLTNNRGVYSSRFPICYGGVLSLSRQGYLGSNYALNTEVGKEEIVNANLSRFVIKKSTLKILTPQILNQIDSIPVGTPNIIEAIASIVSRAPSPTAQDSIMFTITKINETSTEEPYTKFLYFDGDNTQQDLELVPGRYEIIANYYDLNGFTIPARTIEAGGEDVTLDAMEFKPGPLGGAILGEQTGHYFTVTSEDLETGENLELYVFKFSAPTTQEEIDVMGKVEEVSQEKFSLITPKFK